MSLKLRVRQLAKMLLQNALLPFIYFIFSRGRIEKGLVLFADAHHGSCPFSMRVMRKKVAQLENVHIKEFYLDFGKCSKAEMLRFILDFMIAFGRAEHVFICDTFLPVSSCKKRKGTFVTQLWHSGGLLKKAGYDSEDCVPAFYRGEVFGGYDLWTVSAPCVEPIMASSCHQKRENVRALGISRTDIYYSKKYNDLCREKFFKAHPEAEGRQIVLWAPTFRGNAAEHHACLGNDGVPLPADPAHIFAYADHQTAYSAVQHQQVAPVADYGYRNVVGPGFRVQFGDFFLTAGENHIIRRSAKLQRCMRAHRLIHQRVELLEHASVSFGI